MKVQLDNTQANILRPLARRHCHYLFLRFGEQDAAARRTLRQLVAPLVTSAAEQSRLAASWKITPESERASHGRTVGMLGLSASGYHALGLDGVAPADTDLGSGEFAAGPQGTDPQYGWTPRSNEWSAPYQERIDAFLLLCDHSQQWLDDTAGHFRTAFANHGTVVQEERGHRITGARGASMEPFGFRDNVSRGKNPSWIFADHRPDGPAGAALGCYATFLKLEQDVKRFDDLAADAAELLGVTPERVQELAVGRQKSGAPLPNVQVTRHGGMVFKHMSNDVCPYQAHVRAMDLRNNVDPTRIVRRGFPYGGQPDAPSGLLFLSLQKRIEDFVTLIGRAHPNMDPLLSRSEDWKTWNASKPPPEGIGMLSGETVGQQWPGPNGPVCFAINDLVKLLGAAYFFIPPMSLLRAHS
jgi:Dyp-type peroxidase family